jgi:hypothetical protein
VEREDKKSSFEISVAALSRSINEYNTIAAVCNSHIGACSGCALSNGCKLKVLKQDEEKTNTFVVNNLSH